MRGLRVDFIAQSTGSIGCFFRRARGGSSILRLVPLNPAPDEAQISIGRISVFWQGD
jgi:hypothetical protein